MMLTENEKKEYVKQANIRWRTRQTEAFKKTIGKWSVNHPNYMKEWSNNHPNYMKEWRKIHPNYKKEWSNNHPNYKKEWSNNHPNYKKEWSNNHPIYKKERKSSLKRINAGFTLKIGGVALAVVSESDKSIYGEIDEAMRKESASKQDGW